MLQTELARYMAMCGRSTLSKLDRTVLQLHGVPSARSTSNDYVMGPIERRWLHSRSRRKALAALAGLAAGSPLIGSGAAAQLDPRPLRDHAGCPDSTRWLTAFDFEPVMFANIPLSVYDYTAHGDGSEFTLRRNRQAFDWVDLVPGASQSIRRRSTSRARSSA